jgi:hypothetical protein
MLGMSKTMTEQQAANQLIEDGFSEISKGPASIDGIENRSNLCARIFFNQARNEVAKIAFDPAYAVFADWAQSNSNMRVPTFVSHEEFGNRGDAGYLTVTIMERLYELTEDERSAYNAWYARVLASAQIGRAHEPCDDPFGLLSTFVMLASIARAAAKIKTNMMNGFDMKADNVMARQISGSRVLVYSDPFN